MSSAVLQEYCAQKSVDADAVAADVDGFVAFAQALLEAQGLPRDFFSVDELRFVVCMVGWFISVVCAVVCRTLTAHSCGVRAVRWLRSRAWISCL